MTKATDIPQLPSRIGKGPALLRASEALEAAARDAESAAVGVDLLAVLARELRADETDLDTVTAILWVAARASEQLVRVAEAATAASAIAWATGTVGAPAVPFGGSPE